MNRKHILILGYGMQGKAALYDLIQCRAGTEYTVIDGSESVMRINDTYPNDNIRGLRMDIGDHLGLAKILEDVDVAIEAAPSEMALSIARLAAEMGTCLVSSNYYLSPTVENSNEIDNFNKDIDNIGETAKINGCTLLYEFGFDPGSDLIIGKHAINELDEVHEFYSYGAGLPSRESCTNALNYKFSWSVSGVISAYARPAKVITQGATHYIDEQDIFSSCNIHTIQPDGFDSDLECYANGNSVTYAKRFGLKNTVREIGRYTCRYPGHCAFWDTFAKCGFLNRHSIKVGDVSVSPMEVTIALLGSDQAFFYKRNEQDTAYLRVDVTGQAGDKKKRIIYEILDRRDLKTGFTAMQRMVGFTMSIGAQLILNGTIDKHGLVTPLIIPLRILKEELSRRGIKIAKQVHQL